MRQVLYRVGNLREREDRMQYALVTGTDHGIGLELVRQLLERGFFVTACRINEAERQIDELREAYPDRMQIVTVDIGKDESVAGLRKVVEETTPHLDILINNAGILGNMDKTVGDDLDFDEMARVFNVNALGTLRVTNALSGHVKKSEGKKIVNISSEAGSIQDCWREGWFGYCMSKAANNMQAAIVQNAMRKDGVRVLQIHPGHVATFMRGHLDTTAGVTPEKSAEGILSVAFNEGLPQSEHPLYLDYKGEALRY